MINSLNRLIQRISKNAMSAAIALIFIYGCQTGDSMNNGGNLPIINPRNNLYDWAVQYTSAYVDLTDVYFIDNMTGWVVGNENTILSTTLGGNTWPQAPVNSFNGNFRSVTMINENTGWISGDMNGNSVDGNIYISSSGGSYPASQKLSDYPLNAIFSLNESLVWAGGENGQLLYTLDGGNNWKESATVFEFSINDIQFINESEGYALGEEGKIIKSMDGGVNWELNHTHPGTELTSIHFIDTTNGWACGSGNTILKFDDNAENKWVSVRNENEWDGSVWNDIYFLDKDLGWVVGLDGSIYRTEDGGNTWLNESTGLFNDLNAIYMVNNNTGWVVGEEGLILTYTPRN
jgi:photosystem II stability/assembly factor-like uncharacterized protein